MQHKALVAVWMVAVFAGCRGPGGASCAEGSCPLGQSCDPTTQLCVSALSGDVQVVIQQPVNGALLTGTSTPLTGTASAADGGTFSLEYSVGDGGTWSPLSVGADGTFDTLIPLPPVNDQPLPISVRAADAADGGSSQSVVPVVDNVAPVPTFSAADGSRGQPRTLQVTFTEPVFATDAGVAVVLTPDAGSGSWSSDGKTYTVSGLDLDTAYTAQVPSGSVRDSAGNTVAQASTTFRTQAAQPLSGDIISPPAGLTAFLDFDAVSDPDGVVTVVARAVDGSNNVSLVWGRFDPKTGAFSPIQSPVTGSLNQPNLAAVASVQPDPKAPRISGFAVDQVVSSTESLNGFWSVEGQGVQSRLQGTYAVIPTPSGCSEQVTSSPQTVGLAIDQGGPVVYSRPPNGNATLPFAPRKVEVRSADEWEWLAQSGAVIQRQIHRCDCDGASAPGCRFIPATGYDSVANDAASSPDLSAAVVLGRRLYVYDNQDGSSRTEACVTCVTDGLAQGLTCPVPASQVTSVVGQHLRVAPMRDQAVLGARLTASGPIQLQLLQRDLSQSCTGDWTVLGSVNSSTDVFRPVMFGSRPGLLYLTATNTIAVYIP